MIRFDLVRVKMTSVGLAALVAGSIVMATPQASFATDWMELLKPLVTNVLVPGASLGMKKLIQREEKLHPELVGKFMTNSSSTTSATTDVSGSMVDQFFDGSTTTSSANSSRNPFASPEEPISSANTESSAGSVYWAASNAVAATDPAPAPPPPVATP